METMLRVVEVVGSAAVDWLVTTVKVTQGPVHDRIRVWNRGGCAGELVVTAGDGLKIAKLLMRETTHTVTTFHG